MHARAGAATLMTAALCWVGMPSPAAAQDQVRPVATAPEKPGPWVGLDVCAGLAAFERYEQPDPADENADRRFAKTGWNAAATLFVGQQWLGVTGWAGSQTIETMPMFQIAVGPQVVSPWFGWEGVPARVFGHALYGYASASGGTASQHSREWVFGGGMDLLFLRLQYDYVRLDLDPLQRGNHRGFIGGVVPLCLRNCRGGEINLSGRPARR